MEKYMQTDFPKVISYGKSVPWALQKYPQNMAMET